MKPNEYPIDDPIINGTNGPIDVAIAPTAPLDKPSVKLYNVAEIVPSATILARPGTFTFVSRIKDAKDPKPPLLLLSLSSSSSSPPMMSTSSYFDRMACLVAESRFGHSRSLAGYHLSLMLDPTSRRTCLH